MWNAQGRRRLFMIAVAGAAIGLGTAPAGASTILQPSSSPVVVQVARAAEPPAVTVVAGGFPVRALVYVEQCDGVAPSVPQWSPTAHCDLGTSPAPAIVDDRGLATFSSTDANRAFRPFVGESPQSLFNCLAPGQAAPKNGLASYTDCTLRVSTNNAAVTADQTFRALAFAQVPGSATTPTSSSRPSEPTAVTGAAAATRHREKTAAATSRSKTAPVKENRVATSRGVAVVASPPRAKVGLLSWSDARLALGYTLVLVGLLAAALTIALRRRTVTGTQIVGER